MKSVLELARPELVTLAPYSHAAWAPGLERMHANEMPWRPEGDHSPAGLNRYPEPQPAALLARLAELYAIDARHLLVGRGSDEAIDLLVRAFCRAGEDSVLVCPPTFGMYSLAARVQGAGVVEVPLLERDGFALDVAGVLEAWRPGVKIVFLCSPNNPTGNALAEEALAAVCAGLAGRAVVVVDEAYVEFSGHASLAHRLPGPPHLVVLRTLSKAHALAGSRCGTLIAHPDVVGLLRRIIPPYALPSPVVDIALAALGASQRSMTEARIQVLLKERERLRGRLAELPLVARVWPSDANFLLVRCMDAERVLRVTAAAGLLIRDLRRQRGLFDCVRITIGTPEQNDRLVAVLEAAAEEEA
jgi:histidinol-phosphate aminotransferase